MTFTPASIRNDLKCGKGAISKGERCHKGLATKASIQERILKYGGALGAIGSLAYATRRNSNVFAATSALQASVGAVASGFALEGERTKNRAKRSLATAIAASNFSAAAFNAYAARLVGKSKSQEREFDQRFNRGRQQSSEAYSRAWNNAQQVGAGSNGGSRYTGRSRPNSAAPTPYKDLGVSETASDAELKATWLKLMRQNHPDAGGDPRKATQINAAYQEILRRRGRSDAIWASGFTVDWDLIQL